MKKIIAILLAVCLLMLMGCDAGNHNSGQSGAESTRPADVVIVDFDAPALTVKVTINPELKLTLSRTNQILGVKALNADAEALLEGMDLVGQSYESGIVTILEEARNRDFLVDEAGVNIVVEELSNGAWTVLTGEMIIQPVKDYQAASGVNFSCEVTPTGETFDPDTLSCCSEQQLEDSTLKQYADETGSVVMTVYTYTDGRVVTEYPLGDSGNPYDRIVTTEYPDGRYGYEISENGQSSGYIQYPDGSRDTFATAYESGYIDGLDQYYRTELWSLHTSADGSAFESFYKNGELEYQTIIDADGNRGEVRYNPDGSISYTIYYANGNPKIFEYTSPDGTYYEKAFFNEDGNVITEITQTVDGYNEVYYDENGEVTGLFHRGPDGTEDEYIYENGEQVGQKTTFPDGSVMNCVYDGSGVLKYAERTWPNGDYSKTTYDDNGTMITSVSQQGGYYEERYFDENAQMTSSFYRDQDGNECTTTYHENGNPKTVDYILPNGDYEKDTYSDKGTHMTSVSLYGGVHTEYSFDEQGNMVSSIATGEDGSITNTVYSIEGYRLSSETTWLDGSYVKETYKENGMPSSIVSSHDGYYIERYFDEMGQMTYDFTRDPDGKTEEWVYENGQPVSCTVTYADGTTETITF